MAPETTCEPFATFGKNGYPCHVTTTGSTPASALLPLARYLYTHVRFCSSHSAPATPHACSYRREARLRRPD
jgi:hypothetical protein